MPETDHLTPGENKLRKKMRFSIYALSAVSLALPPSPVWAEAGWTDYAPIAELVTTARPYYELRLPVKKNPGGCKENNWFYQDYGLKASDKMFATLLEGLQSRKRVRVYVTGKCNVNGYAEFTAVSIIP